MGFLEVQAMLDSLGVCRAHPPFFPPFLPLEVVAKLVWVLLLRLFLAAEFRLGPYCFSKGAILTGMWCFVNR